MPLEIKEIVVTATVSELSNSGSENTSVSNEMEGIDRNSLIAECVEQVLDILREKNEM